jgi:hypothetical protein
MTIHAVEAPLFGSVKCPVKVAPRGSSIASPGVALSSAACRLPPAATRSVRTVAGMGVERVTRGSSAGTLLDCAVSGAARASATMRAMSGHPVHRMICRII